MARVMSMIMMVFILVPMLAPSVGQLIILVGSWRWLFAVLLIASLTALVWASCRLPETQPPLAAGARRRTVGEALALVLSNGVTFGYGIASGFVLGLLVAYIASSQQVFGSGYGSASCSHSPLAASPAQSRWPRSPTPVWCGALACADCRIPRWSRMSASAQHWPCSAPYSAVAALAGARRPGRLRVSLPADPRQFQCHRHAADGPGRRHGGP